MGKFGVALPFTLFVEVSISVSLSDSLIASNLLSVCMVAAAFCSSNFMKLVLNFLVLLGNWYSSVSILLMELF